MHKPNRLRRSTISGALQLLLGGVSFGGGLFAVIFAICL